MPDLNTPVHGDEAAIASPVGAGDHKQLGATAFERTRMPMVMVDARQPDYPIVLANEAFLDLTGYDADEVIGRTAGFYRAPIRRRLRSLSSETPFPPEGKRMWNC
jgi:PAS domain-containing protein